MKDFGKENQKNFKETEHSTIFLQEGIAQCTFKEIDALERDTVEFIVKDRVEFFAGVPYPCLFDITRVKHSTKEARDYLANEGNELILASAILVNSPVIKMMANFFIMVNKPKNPTRMFTDKESALKWLSQFKSRTSAPGQTSFFPALF